MGPKTPSSPNLAYVRSFKEENSGQKNMNAAEQYLHDRGLKRETWQRYDVEIYESALHAPFWERLNPGEGKDCSIRNRATESFWIPCDGPNGAEERLWICRIFSVVPDKELNHFHIPSKQRSPVWISPETREAAKDVSKPVYVTEGPVKGMALGQCGVCAIAPMGTWGVAEPHGEKTEWKSADERAGEKAHPKPKLKKKYRLRQELAAFRWLSRRVYLCLDADQTSNLQVRQAAIRSFFLFSIVGAEVYQIAWPLGEGKGIDDFLRARGKDGTGENDIAKQRAALGELTNAARPFVASLLPTDVDLFGNELFKVEMSLARREQFARAAAKPLGTTKSALLAGRDAGPEPREGGSAVPPKTEPWARDVDVAEVLEEARADLLERVWMDPGESRVAVLMAMLTFLTDAVDLLPILLITSPEPECGKTTLLKWFLRLTNQAIPASNISAAAIYRLIEEDCPTLILDEADTYMQDNEVMRGVINSGHEREFAYVSRVNPDTGKTERFTTWCPKIIAMIGKPHRTILSRSIVLRLGRKPKGREVKRFDAAAKERLEVLRSKLAKAADQIRKSVRAFETSLLSNRARDNWLPYFAMAHAAGPKWEKSLVAAATKIEEQGRQNKGDFCRYLLEALEEFVGEERARRKIPARQRFFIRTDDILSPILGLNKDNEAPWKARPGDELTAHRLGTELEAYEIRSDRQYVTEKLSGKRKQVRGYWSDELEEAFTQYKQ